MTFKANETVHSRFAPYEAFTVVSCNGCVAVVRDASGEAYPIPVGAITRAAIDTALAA